jgi:hypothetical protein
MNPRIGFKLQIIAMPGFHSLYDWCCQTMWLFPGAPEDPEDDILMEMHWAKAPCSAEKRLMNVIQTEHEHAQRDAAHPMIQIAKPWVIKRWSGSKLANGKPHVWIPKENVHLDNLQWTEQDQAKLKTLVERYTLQRASGVWRVHR